VFVCDKLLSQIGWIHFKCLRKISREECKQTHNKNFMTNIATELMFGLSMCLYILFRRSHNEDG